MVHPRIGFHLGPGGNASGHGDFLLILDSARIPFFCKSADAMPYEAQEIARLSSVPHTVVYRRSVPYQNAPDYPNPDVPIYTLEPEEAALRHWEWHKAGLPIELDPAITWIETINEPDKDNVSGAWWGRFATKHAELCLADGYKWAAFGWATGNPEPNMWDSAEMLDFLRLCAQFPDRLAIALHEYSLADDLGNGFPYLVGRFQFLHDVCDLNYIRRPTILITEFGWHYDDAPPPDAAIPQLIAVGGLYAQHPNIKGEAIWYLGAGFGGIANRVQKLIGPLVTATINTEYPDPEPVETPQPEKHKAIIVKAPQTINNDDWLRACDYAYEERHTITMSHDDTRTLLQGGSVESFVKFVDPAADADTVVMVEALGYRWELLYQDVPAPAFKLAYWPTEYKYVTQDFGARPDYYAQFGLPGHDGVDIRASLGSKVFAVAAGHVYRVETNPNAHNYGIHVRIEHEDGYKTIYGHLQEVHVAAGNVVSGGVTIGLANNTGNSQGSHLHFGMKHPDGLTGWPYELIDPTPFLRPLAPEAFVRIGPPPDAPTYRTAFMRADPRAWRVIRRHDGSGEDVWDLPLGGEAFVRVKNRNEGEWYDGVWRLLDTSPAPDSRGTTRLYRQTTNGNPGGQIAPLTAVLGRVYEYWSDVQFFAKSDCRPLDENSGRARSTFQLVEVIDGYTFPGTGVTVDRLYKTLQTGEWQLYADYQGRRIGWCGGGAAQPNNRWSGELAEVYFDRVIPGDEPKRFCG